MNRPPRVGQHTLHDLLNQQRVVEHHLIVHPTAREVAAAQDEFAPQLARFPVAVIGGRVAEAQEDVRQFSFSNYARQGDFAAKDQSALFAIASSQ